MASLDAPHPLLTLTRVNKKFGFVTALRDVNLDVFPGDFLSIFGPNGAGKTTLLRVIAFLTLPSSGEVRFGADGGSGRGKVGYVSHQSLLYNEMTGQENLEFFARIHGLPDPKGQARDMLSRMGLAEAGDLLVRTYSRGMKQRLSLARALLHEPQLLLLDEPYTGLDQHGNRLLTQVLRQLSHDGRTVLLITHNLEEGLELCTRAVVQHRGRLVLELKRGEIDRNTFEQLYFEIVER
jgi:heme exporter protein A